MGREARPLGNAIATVLIGARPSSWEMPVKPRSVAVSMALSLALSAWSVAPSNAQGTFPTGPVTIVVPIAGSAVDAVTRMIGERASKSWGQPVVVVVKGGAGTVLGTEAVARAKPDGHTIGVAISALSINPAIKASMPYDTVRDIRGVTLLANAAMAAVVNPEVPASSTAEFIAYARSKKSEELSYVTSGIGALGHISGELFQHAAGIKMLHVPYQDSPRAIAELIAGQGQAYFGIWQAVEPQVRAGKLRVLGVFNSARLKQHPSIPTISETLPGVEVISRLGVIAPGGTPKAVIEKISADFVAISRSEEVAERIRSFGMDPVGSSPAEYDAIIADEIKSWTEVLGRAGVRPN